MGSSIAQFSSSERLDIAVQPIEHHTQSCTSNFANILRCQIALGQMANAMHNYLVATDLKNRPMSRLVRSP